MTFDNIPEIEIKVYCFNLFGKKAHLVSQSNYYDMLEKFFKNLENDMEWDDAIKELVMEYHALEHSDMTPEQFWKMYQRMPQACRILSSFRPSDLDMIKSWVTENKRDKKIDDLLG
jgi:hypothetical protein